MDTRTQLSRTRRATQTAMDPAGVRASSPILAVSVGPNIGLDGTATEQTHLATSQSH